MSIDIEKLAREAGGCNDFGTSGPSDWTNGCWMIDNEGLSSFAALVLEQAALKCENMISYDEYDPMGSCAQAIRAMKPKDTA